MNRQGYKELIIILTRVINKQQQVDNWGLCVATLHINGAGGFLKKYIPLWKDKAASGDIGYPISVTGSFTAASEFWKAKSNGTMYANTPYGDARRSLAAFLKSKAEEELALLVGEEHE